MVQEIKPQLQIDPTKRCPYCFTPLKLSAEQCNECLNKVGPVNKVGLAKKLPNYKAYTAAILWALVFAIYVWKIFFQKWLS